MFLRQRDEAPTPARTRSGRVIAITSLLALGAIAVATFGWPSPENDRSSASATTVRAAAAPPTAPGEAVAAQPSTGAPTTSGAPITSEPSTTTDQTVGTTGTVDVTRDPGVVVDTGPTGYIAGRLPVGFVGAGAFNTPGDASIGTGSWIEVWATPDASRTAGRWLALSTNIYGNGLIAFDGNGLIAFDDGTDRVLVGDHYALRQIDADGIMVLTVTTDGQRTATVANHGLTDDEIVEILDNISIDVDTAEPHFSQPVGVLDGLDLVASRATNDNGFGRPTIATQRDALYRSADGTTGFTVSSGPQRPNDLVVNRLLSQISTDPDASALAPDRLVDLAGHSALVGSMGTKPYISQFVMWHDGTSTVMITSDAGMSLTQLLDVAGSVRPSNAGEWLAQLNSHPDQGDSTGMDWSPPDAYTAVGTTTTASQTTWTLGLAVTAARVPPSAGMIWAQVQTARPPDDTLYSGTTSFAFPITADQPQSLNRYGVIDATILIATVDTANASTTAVALRVRLPGLEPVEIPLVPVPSSTISGAAYAFSQVAPYEAVLIDANGVVVMTLP